MKKLIGLAIPAAALFMLGGCPEETEPAGPPAWQVVFDDGALDRALLSVWGTSETNVYAVGGPLGNDGLLALALHFDGESWKELAAGGADSFWWVHGTSKSDVWMVGENGRISHFDGKSFREDPRTTTATLWGLMAFSANDVWAVGGMPGMATPDDVILHFDGTSWTPIALPEPSNAALFKVWGESSDNLFVVGEAGTIWHKLGDTWTRENQPPINGGNLTTVHGCSGTDVFAVGARDVMHFDGSAWSKDPITLTNDVNGVFCGPSGVALVGSGGLKQRRVDGAWVDDFFEEPHKDLHGVWSTDSGVIFAVGGDFVSSKKPNTPRNGVVARYGPGTISSDL